MDHMVTVGMILWPIIIVGALIGLAGFCLFLVWLFNPFRSGH